MAGQILVIVEYSDNKILTHSLETIVMGQKLAREVEGQLCGVLLGKDLEAVSEQLTSYDLDSVVLIEDEALRDYTPEAHCAALQEVIETREPLYVLFPHTYQAIDLAPRLAARLNSALISDCVGFRKTGDKILFTRQMFRNKLYADVRPDSTVPLLVSVQAGACFADDASSGSAPVERLEIQIDPDSLQRKILEKVELTKKKVDLSKAEVVIGIGRGVKKEENLKIIQELAEVLGAEIGASRPVVDNDWLERERQIGSSGQTVSPKLYIAAGVSGAIQHVVGMKNSDCIVAVNQDPNAPIFNIATYGIVGDLLEIIPALTKKIREVKES